MPRWLRWKSAGSGSELLDGVAPTDMLKGIECNFACSTGDVVINS